MANFLGTADTMFESALSILRKIDDTIFPYDSGEYSTACHVGKVFLCQYNNALSVNSIIRTMNSIAGFEAFNTENVQSVLTKMAKNKILRSRVIRNVRHYEINFQ